MCPTCSAPRTPGRVHFDYAFPQGSGPYTTEIGASIHGDLPRVLHYLPVVDILLIIDFNLPEDQQVFAIQRLGEQGVKWFDVDPFGGTAAVYSGYEMDAKGNIIKGHVCVVDDVSLERALEGKGFKVRTSFAAMRALGVLFWGTIPRIPADLLDTAILELSRIGAR